MRTHFCAEQLADPALAEAERNLRACVHCGMCTATCPTYVLRGDERDGPRGRIVMMQQMLERGGTPSDETVTHLDRCLSCLGCRTACPSGVDYARLIDQSRAHIEQNYRRPLADRLLRWTIANVLTRPAWIRPALRLARFGFLFRRFIPRRVRAMIDAAIAMPVSRLNLPPPSSQRRVALLPGCVQQVIAPEIDEAAARLLVRRGISLVSVKDAGCCGALAHHLGREGESRASAKRMIEAFERSGAAKAFEGILITATGCAAHIADYPHLFREERGWQARAKAFASKLQQLLPSLSSNPPLEGGSKFASASEQILGRGNANGPGIAPSLKNPSRRSGFFDPPSRGGWDQSLRVALHVPCSLQHGLRGDDGGELLRAAGCDVVAIPEGHLCCGSAGSYSILQPEIANALRARKLENIRSVKPDVVATANIGCLQHLSGPDAPPIVHIAELLDWAEGGAIPKVPRGRAELMTQPAPLI